jgi:hypothetical protein
VDLLAAMEHWAATRNADPAALYLWIDLFSVNQHVSATMTQEWWSTAFVTGIRATGNVSDLISARERKIKKSPAHASFSHLSRRWCWCWRHGATRCR